jgi:DNA-binding NtrC family response regulator
MPETLKGKKILIVDDEADVLEALCELLDMCEIDCARNFETAEKIIKKKSYDAAILDIMGVKGYDLLEMANVKDLPVLMLTAHAFSPDHLVKSIISGAFSYIPKVEMVDIAIYLDDAIQAKLKDNRKSQIWFRKLKPIFDKKFGPDWLVQYKKDFKKILKKNSDLTYLREELDKIFLSKCTSDNETSKEGRNFVR